MFHVREEGSNDLRYGFNFYPLSSTASIGFRLRLSKHTVYFVRWSKARKRLLVSKMVHDPIKSEVFNRFLKDD